MSEIDKLITEVFQEENSSENLHSACQKTLNDYRNADGELESLSGAKLQMIAWDRS